MDNTKYGNAVDFDVDLHSIFAAYLGTFEGSGIEWWEKSWGNYFATFNEFLGFGWEVMVVVDSKTGRSHIAVRSEQIGLFARMIRTRFGESLSKDPPTTLPLSPVPTRTLSLRRLITITDLAGYRKLSQTLPAAELSYLRTRARAGDVGVAEQLFYAGGLSGERDRGGVGVRDNGVGYSWACVKTVWWEKGGAPQGMVPGAGRTKSGGGKGLILEVGITVVRCANLRAVDVWPPIPEENYRKSHLITEEWVDKRTNSNPPNHPRAYAFGQSRWVAEKNVERIVDATLGALASQENDSSSNTLILLTVGEPQALPVPPSSTMPQNILHLDVLALEFNMLRRAQKQGVPGTPDRQQPLTSLGSLLQTLQIPVPAFAPLGNAGNDAYYTVLAFQKLMMAETRLPSLLFQQRDPQPFYAGPSQSSMSFAQYGALPLPPPISFPGQPSHSRNSSSGSVKRQSELFLPQQPVTSQGSLRQARRASEYSLARPRPISLGDSLGPGQGQGQGQGQSIRPSTPDQVPQPNSVPNTVRQERRAPMPRSQTIFWDDSEYAGSAPGSPEGERERRHSTVRPALKANLTGGPAADGARGRSERLPPSAMRPVGTGSPGASRDRGTLKSTAAKQPAPRGESVSVTPNRSHDNISSLASSPARSRAPPLREGNSSSNLVPLSRDGPADSSSSAMNSSSSDGKSPAAGNGNGNERTPSQSAEGSDKDEGRKKGKKRNNKAGGVKDLAGALARFWVG